MCVAAGPITLDVDGFGLAIDQPVADELNVERPAEDADRHVGEAGGVVVVLGKLVAQLEQRLATMLARAEGHPSQMLAGAVAHDLDEADVPVLLVTQRHHLAGSPEPLLTLFEVPAFVLGAPVLEGGFHLVGDPAVGTVLGREEARSVLPTHFLGGPAHDVLGAAVPAVMVPWRSVTTIAKSKVLSNTAFCRAASMLPLRARSRSCRTSASSSSRERRLTSRSGTPHPSSNLSHCENGEISAALERSNQA